MGRYNLVVCHALAILSDEHAIIRHCLVTQPTLILTYNGIPVEVFAPPFSPVTAIPVNDVDLVWATPKKCAGGIQLPPVLLRWTYNGTDEGPPTIAGIPGFYVPTLAPCRVNDFDAAWGPNYNFTSADWSYNGKPIVNVVPPRTANDFEVNWLKGGLLKAAYWTYNGKRVARIPLKTDVKVNDATSNCHSGNVTCDSSNSSWYSVRIRRFTFQPLRQTAHSRR